MRTHFMALIFIVNFFVGNTALYAGNIIKKGSLKIGKNKTTRGKRKSLKELFTMKDYSYADGNKGDIDFSKNGLAKADETKALKVPFSWGIKMTYDIKGGYRCLFTMIAKTDNEKVARVSISFFDKNQVKLGTKHIYQTFRGKGWQVVRDIFITPVGTTLARMNLLNKYKTRGTIWFCDEITILPLDKVEVSPRIVWQVSDPLYEELLLPAERKCFGESTYIWNHPLDGKMGRLFGLQYGQRYSRDEILEMWRTNRLMPYRASSKPGTWISKWNKESGVGLVMYGPAHWAGRIPVRKSFKFLYGPGVPENFGKKLKEKIEEDPESWWAVSTGDEVIDSQVHGLIEAYNKPAFREKYPELDEIAAIIKEKYGYGKYGIPSGVKSDNEPYSWLATRRYCLDRHIEVQKIAYDVAKKTKVMNGKPPIVFGEDARNGPNPFYYSRQAPYQDAVTGQIMPLRNPWLQSVTFRTKFLRDLTGNETWPCVHTEPYGGARTARQVTEIISQVLRGGGTGIQMWNSDHEARVRGKGCTIFDYYGHKERWDATMSCLKKMRSIGTLRFPKPEFALYYANDQKQTQLRESVVEEIESVFTFFGPSSRTWFKFISDIQVLDKKVDLKKWKVVMIPDAEVQRKEISSQFIDYAQDGRTLVCFDPKVFSYHTDGSSTAETREKIFGIKLQDNIYPATLVLKGSTFWPGMKSGSKLIITRQECYKIKLTGNTKVLATFDNKSPAIVLKEGPRGGKSIYFAFQIGIAELEDPQWRHFMKEFAKGIGLKTDQDIWRFQFPMPPETYEPTDNKEDPYCLTGNNFVWWMNKVHEIQNIENDDATYEYSIAPDFIKEEVARGKKHSFVWGDLTDRQWAPVIGDVFYPKNKKIKKAMQSGRLKLDHYIVAWKDTAPVDITFDFKKTYKFQKVRIVYANTLPGYTVAVSTDGKKFAPVKKIDKLPIANQNACLDTIANFTPVEGRYVRITLSERPKGNKCILSEVEIWGKPSGEIDLKSVKSPNLMVNGSFEEIEDGIPKGWKKNNKAVIEISDKTSHGLKGVMATEGYVVLTQKFKIENLKNKRFELSFSYAGTDSKMGCMIAYFVKGKKGPKWNITKSGWEIPVGEKYKTYTKRGHISAEAIGDKFMIMLYRANRKGTIYYDNVKFFTTGGESTPPKL